MPAREVRMRWAKASKAWSWPMIRRCIDSFKASTPRISSLSIRPTGMPVQPESTSATAWASTQTCNSGVSPWSSRSFPSRVCIRLRNCSCSCGESGAGAGGAGEQRPARRPAQAAGAAAGAAAGVAAGAAASIAGVLEAGASGVDAGGATAWAAASSLSRIPRSSCTSSASAFQRESRAASSASVAAFLAGQFLKPRHDWRRSSLSRRRPSISKSMCRIRQRQSSIAGGTVEWPMPTRAQAVSSRLMALSGSWRPLR